MGRKARIAVVAGVALVMLAGPSLVDANAGGVVTKCLTGDTSLCLVYSYDFRPEDKWGYLSLQSNGSELARYQCTPHRMIQTVDVTATGASVLHFDDYAVAVAGVSTYQAPGLPLWPLVEAASNVCYGFAHFVNALP